MSCSTMMTIQELNLDPITYILCTLYAARELCFYTGQINWQQPEVCSTTCFRNPRKSSSSLMKNKPHGSAASAARPQKTRVRKSAVCSRQETKETATRATLRAPRRAPPRPEGQKQSWPPRQRTLGIGFYQILPPTAFNAWKQTNKQTNRPKKVGSECTEPEKKKELSQTSGAQTG